MTDAERKVAFITGITGQVCIHKTSQNFVEPQEKYVSNFLGWFLFGRISVIQRIHGSWSSKALKLFQHWKNWAFVCKPKYLWTGSNETALGKYICAYSSVTKTYNISYLKKGRCYRLFGLNCSYRWNTTYWNLQFSCSKPRQNFFWFERIYRRGWCHGYFENFECYPYMWFNQQSKILPSFHVRALW